METNDEGIDAFFKGLELPQNNINSYKVFTPKIIREKKEKSKPRQNEGTKYVQEYQKVLETDLAKAFSTLDLTGITRHESSTINETQLTEQSESQHNSIYEPASDNNHRKELAIFKFKKEILQKVRTHPVTIIRGLTGCGKTTQVCQYLLDDCNARNQFCNILVSQPRKIAAITVAQRVCQERNVVIGTSIGYQVGLNKKVNKSEEDITQITFCTTGVILQRLLNDKSMGKYTHIILDEVHERDIEIDFLVILVRRFLAISSPFTKIILMSATLNSAQFQEFFKIPLNESIENEYIYPPIIDLNSAKRVFEIKELYLDDISKHTTGYNDLIDYNEPEIKIQMYDLASKLILLLLKYKKNAVDQRNARNILVFLPGLHEIERLQEELEVDEVKKQLRTLNVEICILHSSLSTEEQKSAFTSNNKTKIILSTNIAESSVTLPAVVYVIDFCLTKNLSTRHGTQMSSLVLSWATKNNCKQRAGRTGRVMSGVVYRLIHKEFYRKLQEQATPEIRIIPLESVVIKIKKLEMGSPLEILAVSLDPPDHSRVVDAVLSLKEFGGLLRFNKDGKFEYTDGELTHLGDIMSAMPCDIRVTRLIVLGYMFSVLEEAIIIGAGLNIKGIFINSLSDKMGAYVKKVKWSKGSASDCIAIYHAYSTWIYRHENKYFYSIDEERAWCRSRGLDLKNLNEMRLLIAEFKKRLEAYKIVPLKDFNQPTWLPDEKIFILKVIIAGAFGVANFFLPDHRDSMERDILKNAHDLDLHRTVYFRGFDKHIIGDIYRERMKEIFVEKGVCSKNTEVKFFFDYGSTGQVFVTFENDNLSPKSDFEFDLGNVAPEVYKAVKMRLLNSEFRVPVLSNLKSLYYAQDQYLGEVIENGFVYKSFFLKKPQYYVMPTNTTDKMKGKITYIVDCGKFYFRPEVAYCSILDKSDDIYKKINENLKKMLENAELIEITQPDSSLKYGQLVIFKNNKLYPQFDDLERAKFISVCNNDEVMIDLIDRGTKIEVPKNKIFDIADSTEISIIPPRVFECRLKEVKASHLKSFDGKWSIEAIEKFRTDTATAQKCIIEIYSVIDDVVAVDLKTINALKLTHWNKQFVEDGYGEEWEESMTSKSNYLLRKRLYYSANEMDKPEEVFAKVIDKNELQKFIESPSKNKCTGHMNLIGPYSPIEKNLRGISTILNSQVSIESSSLNHVLLDEDFYQHSGKFYVAGDLTCNARNQNVRCREVTKMPSIPGLAVILALIFAPYAEIRRDSDANRYVSILTGLGFDEENSRPYFVERDASLAIDFALTPDEINKINNLRFVMSNLLYTTSFENLPDLNDSIRAVCLNNIKKIFLSLINNKQNMCESRYPKEPFTWLLDQEDSKKLTNSLGYRAIFGYHAISTLKPMTKEKHEKLKNYVERLEKGLIMDVCRECKICEKAVDNEMDLELHIMSKMHANRKKELGI
ncbi:hypothetical protein PVAND_004798 [Polypedilum vanderplanki]|uniref:Probable ATP-dependent RNA helicase spindle-E n=1 Tax=Polypedilum vanderplanki TaxID=319348 RepID=A0A9J6BZ63_POLVA|nr:hypothetical protein PVAND_004798 [Polypedilum vanderplanki]